MTDKARADEVALEFARQLITLSSGVVALSAAFVEKLSHAPSWVLLLLGSAWVSLLVSIFCGLQTISTIVKSRLEETDAWSEGYGLRMAIASKYSFLVGILGIAAFAFSFLSVSSPDEKPTTVILSTPPGGAIPVTIVPSPKSDNPAGAAAATGTDG